MRLDDLDRAFESEGLRVRELLDQLGKRDADLEAVVGRFGGGRGRRHGANVTGEYPGGA